MIRFPCPGCEKKLSVKDEMAGRIAVCPSCKHKVRIPQPEAPADDADEQEEAVPPPERPVKAGRRLRPADDEDEAPLRPARRSEEEEVEEQEEVEELDEVGDGDEEEPSRKPARKRKKIRARSRGWDWFSGETVFNKIVIAAISLNFMLAVLAVFLPPIALIPLLMSLVMLLAGHVMVLLAAFQDDGTSGCLCLLIPFYSLYFVLTHLDEVRSALLLYAGSFVLVIISFCGMCAGGMLWKAVTPPPRHGQISWPTAQRVAAG